LSGGSQPIARMWVACATSASAIAEGLPAGIVRPSARRPAIARVDSSSCGDVPRNVALNGRPRSAANLLKYAVAITLFAAPCSHTKMMLGDALAVLELWPSTINNAAAVRTIVIICAPQNR